jgi:peptidoglycan/xylan/chitin deacetylase (PgdA/CDA1 family)
MACFGVTSLQDGLTALRSRPRPKPPFGVGPARPGRRRRWSRQRHHRRRRAVALLLLALAVALVAGLVWWASSGGVAARHAEPALGGGYFARLQTLAGSGARSLARAEQAAENRAIDRTLAYTPYVRVAGSQHRELALTFDDGPGPYTPQIISILAHRGVPATFFEVGVLERYFHASTTAIVAHDWPIGDHTEDHAPMGRLPAAVQQSELLQDTSVIGRHGVAFPRLFRPPYGLWNATTLALLHRYRMLMVLWTVDTGDYRRPGVQAIVDSALSGARPGAIILLHDAGGDRAETVAALPEIIAGLRARGYRLVTVPRLLLDNPAPANQQVYSLAGGGG